MSLFSLKKNDVLICMQHKSDLLSAIEKQGSAKKTKKSVQFLHYLGEIIRGERQFTNSKIISSREIIFFFLISGEKVPDIRNTSLEETILIFFPFCRDIFFKFLFHLDIFYIIF